jgi:hypothetical protein
MDVPMSGRSVPRRAVSAAWLVAPFHDGLGAFKSALN